MPSRCDPIAPVVRLMNLHKVKGLEAPIVFLSDPTGQFRTSHRLACRPLGCNRAATWRSLSPGQPSGSRRSAFWLTPATGVGWKTRNAVFKRRKRAAALRGRDPAGTCLMVARREKKPKENPWYSLTQDLSDREIHQDPGPQARPARPELRITDDEINASTAAIAGRWADLERKTYTTEPMKKLALGNSEPPGCAGRFSTLCRRGRAR